MDDPRGVRGRQRPRDLPRDVDRGADLERLLQQRPQCSTVHQLLNNEVVARGGFPDVVDRDDIGVVQRGGGASFADKAHDRRFEPAARLMHHLHGNRAVQARIDGAKHFAHPAATNDAIEAVVTEGRIHAGHVRRGRGRGIIIAAAEDQAERGVSHSRGRL